MVEAEARYKQADFAATRAKGLVERLAQRRRALAQRELLGGGPHLFSPETWEIAGGAIGAAAQNAAETVGSVAQKDGVWNFYLALAAALGALLYLRLPNRPLGMAVDGLISGAREAKHPALQILCGAGLVALRAGPPIAVAVAAAQAVVELGELRPAERLFVWRLAEAVAIAALTSAFARIIFAPRLPETRVIDLGDDGALRAVTWSTALAAVIAGRRAVLDPMEAARAAPEAMVVVGFVFALAAAPLVIGLGRLLSRALPTSDEGEQNPEDAPAKSSLAALLRATAVSIAIIAPAAVAAGYYALSRFALDRAVATGALALGVVLLYDVTLRLLRGPARGEAETEASAPGASAPAQSKGLYPAVVTLLLAVLAAPVLAYIWGAASEDIRGVGLQVMEGFQIGESTFSPMDLITALAVLVIGVWITRFVQRLVRRDVLPTMRLDVGVQGFDQRRIGLSRRLHRRGRRRGRDRSGPLEPRDRRRRAVRRHRFRPAEHRQQLRLRLDLAGRASGESGRLDRRRRVRGLCPAHQRARD